MTQRAIIAGRGGLPKLLMEAGPALVVAFDGVPVDVPGPLLPARFEALGALFDGLRAEGVAEVCFAGALSRVRFDPEALDAKTRALAPKLAEAQRKGDAQLLGDVREIFEAEGFTVFGAHDLRPDLLVPEGAIAGVSSDLEDAARGRAVLEALAPLDVGQAAVVADGQVLGIETLQGTDAMLAFVAETCAQTESASRGVLVKRAKTGQDLQMDMPAIGPETVKNVAQAGLAGIELQAGHVLLLDPDAVRAACAKHGIALWGHP